MDRRDWLSTVAVLPVLGLIGMVTRASGGFEPPDAPPDVPSACAGVDPASFGLVRSVRSMGRTQLIAVEWPALPRVNSVLDGCVVSWPHPTDARVTVHAEVIASDVVGRDLFLLRVQVADEMAPRTGAAVRAGLVRHEAGDNP